MKLYINQKVFSWGDKFAVKNEYGEDIYFVKGEVFSFGKKLHVYDNHDRELALIKQKVMSFLPKYLIIIDGNEVAAVTKKISMLKQKYIVDVLNWNVVGDFLAHEYSVFDSQGNEIITVHKEYLTWGDTYTIDITDGVDNVAALSLLLVIDACLQQEQQQTGTVQGYNSNN